MFLRVLLAVAVVWALWRLLRGLLEGAGVLPMTGRQAGAVKLVRDPICGTFVSPVTALAARASGETAYFCSEQCRQAWSGVRSCSLHERPRQVTDPLGGDDAVTQSPGEDTRARNKI